MPSQLLKLGLHPDGPVTKLIEGDEQGKNNINTNTKQRKLGEVLTLPYFFALLGLLVWNIETCIFHIISKKYFL